MRGIFFLNAVFTLTRPLSSFRNKQWNQEIIIIIQILRNDSIRQMIYRLAFQHLLFDWYERQEKRMKRSSLHMYMYVNRCSIVTSTTSTVRSLFSHCRWLYNFMTVQFISNRIELIHVDKFIHYHQSDSGIFRILL